MINLHIKTTRDSGVSLQNFPADSHFYSNLPTILSFSHEQCPQVAWVLVIGYDILLWHPTGLPCAFFVLVLPVVAPLYSLVWLLLTVPINNFSLMWASNEIHIKCMFDIVNAVNRCINVRCQTLVASDGIQGDLRQVICLHKPNSNVFWTT